ncbi:MAG: beta-N-acetylhexosaminidase [Deltaproteobacteria bacterium]|nr:beta-N-acetylhexosaminidase [Deltaproteobacteria bacterium]
MNVAQLVMMGIEGVVLTAAEREVLASMPPGGIILFSRNCPSASACVDLVAEIQGLNHSGAPPVLIAIDQEFGPVCRLRDGMPTFPWATALGGKGELSTTETTAWHIGQCLADYGVNMNLAPVADLACSGSLVLADRCFASDPREVADQVNSYIVGLQSSGLAACAKHFPGHGSVTDDSHAMLPVSFLTLDDLASSHLLPFAAAINAGVKVIMTAHLLFPELDPSWPVTLSPLFLNHILRKQLGFDGVILSDDLDMAAMNSGNDLAMVMCQGLKAGLDMVLWGRNIKKGDDPRRVLFRLQKMIRDESSEFQEQLAGKQERLSLLRKWLEK